METTLPKVSVVVRGGCVVAVISEEAFTYALVDFDNEEAGGLAWGHGWEVSEPWDNMAEDVAEALEWGGEA